MRKKRSRNSIEALKNGLSGALTFERSEHETTIGLATTF